MNWLWGQIICVAFFCYTAKGYPSPDEDYPGDVDSKSPAQPPQIISQPTVFKVSEGESVTMPCEIINKDNNAAQLWYHNSNATTIFADDHCFARHLLCSNVEFRPDGSLVIKNVTSNLGGQYYCQYRNAVVVHTLHIKPTVDIPFTKKTLEVGEDLTLNCKVTGFPAPNVVWYRQSDANTAKITVGTTANITIPGVTESMSGIYTCAAFNTAEDNPQSLAMKSVNVHIINGVAADSDVINAIEQTGPTNICCSFDKNKKVMWFRNDKELAEIGARYEIKLSKRKSCVSIQKVKEEDLGKYTCKVVKDNNAAVSADTFLTGFPLTPTLLSATHDDAKNPVLVWKVKTFSPITKYIIKIKKVEETTWKVYDESGGQEGQEVTIRETFKDIPDGTYDVEVEVQNKFGSSKYMGSASLVIDNPKNPIVIAAKINSSATSLRVSVLCGVAAAVTWFLSC